MRQVQYIEEVVDVRVIVRYEALLAHVVAVGSASVAVERQRRTFRLCNRDRFHQRNMLRRMLSFRT